MNFSPGDKAIWTDWYDSWHYHERMVEVVRGTPSGRVTVRYRIGSNPTWLIKSIAVRNLRPANSSSEGHL